MNENPIATTFPHQKLTSNKGIEEKTCPKLTATAIEKFAWEMLGDYIPFIFRNLIFGGYDPLLEGKAS